VSHRLNRARIPLLFFVGASMLLMLAGCAEVAPPPGGEADKLSPVLTGSIPENGAVNVALGNSVTLFFSERIVEPKSGKAVFISPRPAKEPKLKWKTDRLQIILPDSFRTNETYIISLSANITDLRGNKLDSSAIIAFSTGPSLDSGSVAGHVYSKDKPLGGLMVVLYRASAFEDTTMIIDSLYPDYVTQSNKEGLFTFQYLPSREYLLVAFDDKNLNERFDPARESFALADRPIIPGGEMPLDNLELSLTTQDTVTSEVISAAFTADRLLKVRLSREIPLDLLRRSPSNIMLRSQEDTNKVYAANSFLESDTTKTSVLNCHLGYLSEGVYDLELTYDVSKPTIHYRGIQVKIVEDKNSPTVVRFYPDQTPQFVDKIKVQAVFSEPLYTARITEGTFVLHKNPDMEVPLSCEWQDAFHLILRPSELKEGASYTLSVTEFEIADMAGNLLGDSLRKYPFSTLDSDSLGSVSGEVVAEIAGQQDSPTVLSFKKVGTNQIFDLSVSGRKFKIDVPAGKYLLSGFVDSDLDGQKGNGSIYPFHLAETSASYADTIAVRARFETTGIKFEFK
jgi:hypothetical protein